MQTSDYIAIVAAIIAAYSAWVSRKALDQSKETAKESLKLSERSFKRQHVIDLHLAWLGSRQLDPSEFDNQDYVDEIVKAGNLLGLTATMWNHDVVEKAIIYQNYWAPFNSIYQALDSRKTTILTIRKSGSDFLTDDIQKAYMQMKEWHENERRKRLAVVDSSTIRD